MVFCVQVFGWLILVAVGVKLLVNGCSFIYVTYLAAAFKPSLICKMKHDGSWAVVTGATDGIGKAFAQQLAALGLNVVLVSRSATKLRQVADEISRENSGSQIRTVAVDFTDGDSIYPKLKDALSHLAGRIGIVVNNVGMKLPTCPIANVPSGDQFDHIINCNVMSMARLTNLLLPAMRKKKRGFIINVGSIAATGFAPMRTTYGATKAFVDKFSCDLAAECRSDGIIVQSLLPGYVATKLPGLSGQSSLDVPTADTYVTAALHSLSVETRTAAYWFHKILLYWTELLYFFVPNLVRKLTVHFIGRKAQRAIIDQQDRSNISNDMNINVS